jgi:hypothetical protein
LLQVEAAVRGRVWSQPSYCLPELTFCCDRAAATGLIPGDRHVHESLQEVALLRRRRAPGDLELLVRGEVLAGPDQCEPAFELRL